MKNNVYFVERKKDDPDYRKIDFEISDDNGKNIAWVWGDTPSDMEVECCHYDWETDDNDPDLCVCKICGAVGKIRKEVGYEDTGHDDNGSCTGHQTIEKTPCDWGKPLERDCQIKEVLKGYEKNMR